MVGKKEHEDFGKKVKPKGVKKSVKKTVVPVPIKKGFFSRLKENTYKHRYKIAAGVGTALVVGAGAGAAYKISKDKEEKQKLVQQTRTQQSEIERLKKVPLPSTLNINSLKKYFNDSQTNLENLNKEKEQLYKKYESEVSRFTGKLDELATLEAKLKNANDAEKENINFQITGLQETLQKMEKENEKLQEQLNAKVKAYELAEKTMHY